MVRAVASYVRHEVWPRRSRIAVSTHFAFSVAAGLLFGLDGGGLAAAKSKIGDIDTAALAYAAVAFGFSLAGLTVALTLPNERFTLMLATVKRKAEVHKHRLHVSHKRPDANAYSDLLFVFSWTALVHWLLIAGGFGLLAARGTGAALLGGHPSAGARILAGVAAGLVVYAVFQFLVVLITVSQLGRTYIDFLRNNEQPRAETELPR